MGRWSSILITGASSGLGEALALAYAEPGVTLFLAGRDPARTEAVAAACRGKGAKAEAGIVDVASRQDMAAWVADAEARAPLDLVVANAGVTGVGNHRIDSIAAEIAHVFPTNVDGVLNTVLPALPAMQRRRRGQIALMSSLAGFRGFGVSPAYCASKAAVRVWGEGLRQRLARDNVGVTVICPGFVKSRMTDGSRLPMPFLMDAERAAAIMRRGIEANRGRVAFPWQMAAATWLLGVLPDRWSEAFAAIAQPAE